MTEKEKQRATVTLLYLKISKKNSYIPDSILLLNREMHLSLVPQQQIRHLP